MSISMYSASVPVFKSMLGNLLHILEKGDAFVQGRKLDPNALTQFRLAPDMLPFTRQVLIACDAAKNGVARMSGVAAPKFDDTETSFFDLKERIRKTIAYLDTVPPGALDGTEEKDITFPSGAGSRTMKGEDYLKRWALPNFYFHVTTAYVALRHNGVELGKADYLLGATRDA